MFTYRFKYFISAKLRSSIFGASPLGQVTMVGPYVTLYIPRQPRSEHTFNHHRLCVFSDVEPDHDDAHGGSSLDIFSDQEFNHVHVILPGKQPLHVELKKLLMSDQAVHGITESEVNQCVESYLSHVEHYSPSEHKLAVRNVINSAVKYHYKHLPENDSDHGNELLVKNMSEDGFRRVVHALAKCMFDKHHSSLENFREVLHEVLEPLEQNVKNAFLCNLYKVIPESPYKDFNRLVMREGPFQKDLSPLGFLALLAPSLCYVLISLMIKSLRTDTSSNKIEVSIIDLPILWLIMYKAPEIAEGIYSRSRQLLFNPPYIANPELKKLVDKYEFNFKLN